MGKNLHLVIFFAKPKLYEVGDYDFTWVHVIIIVSIGQNSLSKVKFGLG